MLFFVSSLENMKDAQSRVETTENNQQQPTTTEPEIIYDPSILVNRSEAALECEARNARLPFIHDQKSSDVITRMCEFCQCLL